MDIHINYGRFILGTTSTWMFLPLLLNISNNKNSNLLYKERLLLYIIIFLSGSQSIITWRNVNSLNISSFYWKLDRLYSRLLFLNCLFIYNTKSIFITSLSLRYIFPCGIIIFYIFSRFFENNNYKLFILSHLLFRYIGFWWIYLILLNDKYIFYNFIINSSLYFGNIFILLFWTSQKNINNYNIYYNNECLKIMYINIIISVGNFILDNYIFDNIN